MNDSWIALANLSGLKALVLEEKHALPFMHRRAGRENALCFWAVLAPHHAGFIQQKLREGDHVAALAWLDRLASDLGRISPPEVCHPDWICEYVTIPDERDTESSS